jgi:hypothetical protein
MVSNRSKAPPFGICVASSLGQYGMNMNLDIGLCYTVRSSPSNFITCTALCAAHRGAWCRLPSGAVRGVARVHVWYTSGRCMPASHGQVSALGANLGALTANNCILGALQSCRSNCRAGRQELEPVSGGMHVTCRPSPLRAVHSIVLYLTARGSPGSHSEKGMQDDCIDSEWVGHHGTPGMPNWSRGHVDLLHAPYDRAWLRAGVAVKQDGFES